MKCLSLKGRVIAITRPEKQADELAELVSKLGGKAYVVPTIEIKPARNPQPIKRLINNILSDQIDFVIFMSVNGVTSLIRSAEKLTSKIRFLEKLGKSTIVAVGPKTGKELEKQGIKVDFVPRKYSSEGIIESFKKLNIKGKTLAIPRSSKSDKYLMHEFEQLGATVVEISVYECIIPTDRSKVFRFINDLREGKIDVVTFTSSFTARNLFKVANEYALADELRECLEKTIIATIGPVTQNMVEELGVTVHVVPKEYTIEGMMHAIVRYLRHNN